MITVIDYGAGNLKSVGNALSYLGVSFRVSSEREEILTADKVLLPGVGAFGDAMESLRTCHLVNTLYDVVEANKPFLGICLGYQLLFESSEESPGVSGLGILPGKVRRLPEVSGLKIPQIGWNSIACTPREGSIFAPSQGQYVYFVHSYYVEPKEDDVVACYTDYGIRFASAVERGNLHACQFHPEKSGRVGLEILKRFAESR